MGFGIWELLIILVLVLLLFGAGKLPGVMSDLGKGIRNLREGLKSDNQANDEPKKKINDSKRK